MARTTTKCVDFQALSRRGPSAAIIVRLMMACNDLVINDLALADWTVEERRTRAPRQRGARMYFVRAQIGHLHEALKIIEDLRKNKDLSMLVESCDSHTRFCFHELEQHVQGGTKADRFRKLVGNIRDNLAFHYNNEKGRRINKAISDRAARPEVRTSLITRGDHMHLWHFKAADDVVDSAVVRQIWEIPPNSDVRAGADAIAEEVHTILRQFLDFSGEVIWRYL
jgi:hypothetical protein